MKRKKVHRILENIFLLIIAVIIISTITIRTVEVNASYNQLKNAKLVEYTIKKGDTIWTIAKKTSFADFIDIRAIVDKIIEDNDLESSIIHPGQTILIPEL